MSWDGKKFRGHVDIGSGIDDDSSPVAREALVFMTVSLTNAWKVPCAYFFIDGMSGEERANLVEICVQRLTDVGVDVVSITADGLSAHLSMLSILGASLDPPNVNPSFPHPCVEGKNFLCF